MDSENVITLRMPKEDVQALEELSRNWSYYKRSAFIRAATEFFLKYAGRTTQMEIMAGYCANWKNYKFEIKKIESWPKEK